MKVNKLGTFLIVFLLLIGQSLAQSEACDCSDGTPTTEAQLLAGGSFCGNTTIAVGGTFNPLNEICWSGGTLTLTGNDADVNIGGIFQMTGGTIDLDADSNQDVDILSGGNLIVGSGATFFAQDQIDVASGGQMNISGTVFSNTQEITVASGGTINVLAGGSLSAGSDDEITVAGTMNVYGTVTSNASSFVTGTMTIYSSGTLTVANGGDLTADGGDINISGVVNVSDDLEVYNGGNVNILGINAVVTVGDDVEVVGGSTLYVSQNGTINVGNSMYNATSDGGGGQDTGTIIIDGTANIDDDLIIYDTTPDSGLSGSGTINSTNGTIIDNEGDNNFACTGTPQVCTGNNTPLPVELTMFSFELKVSSVVLQWTTASELNNLGFYLQKSLTGKNFTDIAFVEGMGTTSETHNYSYIDKSTGQAYYRLRQVDFDGSTNFSKIIFTPSPELATSLRVYPNPTTGEINIGEGLTNYSFYSSSGQLLERSQNTTSYFAQQQISNLLKTLEPGIYFLKSNMNGQSQTFRIIKE